MHKPKLYLTFNNKLIFQIEQIKLIGLLKKFQFIKNRCDIN